MKNNIINRNLFRLLYSGAFNCNEPLEPMSAFKWKRLLQITEVQDVKPYVARGLRLHQDDPNLPISPSLQQEIENITSLSMPDVNSSTLKIMQTAPQLSNILLKRRLKSIIRKEENSESYSLETLQLLNTIIHNVNHTLTNGISLRGIIDMGRFLRTKGNLVDFVKLEKWLHHLGMVRMASLQGSILIDIFKFSIDELPFMNKEETSATYLTQRSLTHTAADTAENWHFRMRTNGMVENNSRVLRRNLTRSLRYIRFNPFETASNFLANFSRSLSEIEE
ncbi:MAG: hypothetical protein MR681_10285 [Prevotella sp.]|nr:hypothetical protein [Prevotella sp.]